MNVTEKLEFVTDCMVFDAVFNVISVILQWPVHLSMLSLSSFITSAPHYILSKPLAAFPNITIVKTMDSIERGMNPVTMTFINPCKEYWPSW